MFFKGSRYQNVPEHKITDSSGRTVTYKRIRFIPKTPAMFRHRVQQVERLDLISHHYFQDPDAFWCICDANYAMLPDDLTAETGRQILIPSPLR